MNFSALRVVYALFAIALLSACSSASPFAPGVADDRVPNATGSPCKISGAWYFRGSCKTFSMKPKGTAVSLEEYRGVALTMRWSANHPGTGNYSFIAGDALGKGDVTGKYGNVSFPVYGSTTCTDQYLREVSCRGKAFLYNITKNASSYEIGWNTTPKIRISNSGAYPGTTCQLASLGYLAKGKVHGWIWQLYPIHGKPVAGALELRPWNRVITLEPGEFGVFGFICY